jgi:hypothetical protein
MSLVECPEPGCTAPAEIVDRMVLGSCTGPVPHARTVCLARHWFFMPAARLVALPAARPRPVSRRG